MFHRVTKDQEDEQKVQEQEEKSYRKEARDESPSTRDARGIARDEEKEDVEEREERSYSRRPSAQSKERTEERAEKSEPVQGKYAREPEEEQEIVEEPPRSYAPSAPRGYSAGYGPTSSYVPPEAPGYAGNDRTLTIGRGINMSGEIDACDHLMVEGTVEAALKGAKLLEIAESGTFYGTVEIEEATIAGRFEGDITVSGRLTVKQSGVITGSIAYRDLEVESGAVVDGRMTPLKPAVDEKAVDQYRAGTGASAMAKVKAPTSKKAANNEAGLFSKAHASY